MWAEEVLPCEFQEATAPQLTESNKSPQSQAPTEKNNVFTKGCGVSGLQRFITDDSTAIGEKSNDPSSSSSASTISKLKVNERIITSPLTPIKTPEKSFPQLAFDCLEEHGDRLCEVDASDGRFYTFRQVADLSRRVASALIRRGLQMGECFCVYIPNSIDYVVAFLGITSAGGVVTTANPSYVAEELQYQLNDCSAVYLLATESNIQEALKVKQNVLSLKEIFVLGNKEKRCSRFSDLLEDDGSFFHKPVTVEAREVSLVLPYSSGTTWLPKGVILTHHNIISNIYQVTHPDIFPLTTKDVILGVLPFFHCFGLVLVSLCSVIRGCSVVVTSRFKPELFLTAVQQYKVTVILLAPPIAQFLVESPLVDKYDLSSVTTILSGAAALHPQVAVKLQAKFPSARIGQGYGMTEVSPVACVPLVGQTLYESVGVPVPGTRMKIVSIDGGATLGPGEKGEILISGPQVMKGYLNNPKATRLIIDENGWLHTGDVGFYTEDKKFYVVERIKELIKYKGYQVAPAELELLLMKHPGICDAAVVGVTDPRVGELARAFVVVKPSHNDVTSQNVQEFVAEHVAPYKHLHGGVEFVSHIPRNASGKILRRKLRAKIFPK
ncbi:uncharacterized protein LOC143226826 isoform X2 [Tachypleus tridentatus]|uniref:uncharacterized protein LOC143226826 isoform X2 n=1 Tax=Tachypleus tridentatus TaxID=6853 RepID=UPI003FD2D99A